MADITRLEIVEKLEKLADKADAYLNNWENSKEDLEDEVNKAIGFVNEFYRDMDD